MGAVSGDADSAGQRDLRGTAPGSAIAQVPESSCPAVPTGDQVASLSVPFLRVRPHWHPTPTPPPQRAPGGRAWVLPAVLVISCLVIGFIAGWVLRGDDGLRRILAPPAPEPAGQAPADTAGGTTTAPSTTAPPATTAGEPAAAPQRATRSASRS